MQTGANKLGVVFKDERELAVSGDLFFGLGCLLCEKGSKTFADVLTVAGGRLDAIS